MSKQRGKGRSITGAEGGAASVVVPIVVAVVGAVGMVVGALAGAGSGGAEKDTPSVAPEQAVAISLSVPEDGEAVTDWPTRYVIRGTISAPLTPGHSIWFATRQIAERGFHPAREACEVSGQTFVCSVLYLGRADEHGADFRFEIWDADTAATARLETFAERGADDNTPISRPGGARVAVDIPLRRR